MGKIKTFKELKIWQKGITLAIGTYNLTSQFPNEEKFGIISQMQRASTSVSANIAEGWSRKHTKEFIHFLHISLGSLAELETFLEISKQLKYIQNIENFDKILNVINELQKMIYTMLKSLSANL